MQQILPHWQYWKAFLWFNVSLNGTAITRTEKNWIHFNTVYNMVNYSCTVVMYKNGIFNFTSDKQSKLCLFPYLYDIFEHFFKYTEIYFSSK